MPILQLEEGIAPGFVGHLLEAPERVAFLRGARRSVGERIDASESWFVDERDLDLSDRHVALSDAAMGGLMGWAAGSAVLVEAHSHGDAGGPAAFSWTDLDGLAAWVPHLSWRLPDLTYVAVVYGAGSFDGLVWMNGRGPAPLTHIVLGSPSQVMATTQLSLTRWHERSDHG